MTAQQKLERNVLKGLHITVGLDPDIKKIPSHLHTEKDPVLTFLKKIIDSTAEYSAAYKLNFAFFEKDGAAGIETLLKAIEYIPAEKLIIADAKRGDIGNTSQMYAISAFDHFKADAITLHPYMGFDSVEPFLAYEGKISFILALTSNKGSMDFEKLRLENDDYLFQKVIKKTAEWNTKNNCGLVFGATNETELEENIRLFGQMPVLLPGIGAQGGSLEKVVTSFKNHEKNNFLINVSRSVLYMENSVNFDKAAQEEVLTLNREIDMILNK